MMQERKLISSDSPSHVHHIYLISEEVMLSIVVLGKRVVLLERIKPFCTLARMRSNILVSM